MSGADLSRIRLASHEKELPRPPRRRIGLVAGLVGMIAVVVVLILLFRSGPDDAPAEEAVPAAAEPPAADRTPLSASTVSAGGYIEARRTAILNPGRTGVIEALHVEPGQVVQAGAVLLVIEAGSERAAVAAAEAALARSRARLQLILEGPRAEQIESAGADVRAAEADLESARRHLQRVEELAASGSVAPADLEEARFRERASAEKLAALRAQENLLRAGSREAEIAESRAEVRQAEATLAQARATFDLATMRAPFDGVVVRVDLEVGETVSLFGGLNRQDGIVLADVSELWVRVDVPEARIGGIRLGGRAEVVVDAIPGSRLEAEVVEIAPVADRQSNTIEVAVRILDPPALLRPDMSARVSIETKSPTDE